MFPKMSQFDADTSFWPAVPPSGVLRFVGQLTSSQNFVVASAPIRTAVLL